MLTITIDGPAGAGKSTTASLVAKALRINHLNTGAMYRAVAVKMNDYNIDYKDEKAIDQYMSKIKLEVIFIDGKQRVLIDGEDVTERLYENAISNLSSLYSTHYCVRQTLTNTTRKLSQQMSFIIDGRDSGSYVLPDAKYKFYLDCDAMERARRRHEELKQKGTNIEIEQLYKEIVARDEFDKNKKIAPLVVPKDAIVVDNTKLTTEQTVSLIVNTVQFMKN